jgi:phospholipid/cholesterol/gamma-HCH transport system substrate-binding protein
MNQVPTQDDKKEDLEAPPAAKTGRKEAWVGLFAVAGLLCILVSLFTFTEPATFRGGYPLTTLVANAGGIRKGDEVQLRGVPVGRIKGFEIAPQGVTVRLEIESRYRVPRDAHVVFSSNALVGGAVAQIVGGESTEPAPPGAVLPGESPPPLQQKVGEVAGESEKTLQRVQDLLSERTVDGVEGSVEQLHALLTELSQTVAAERSDIDRIVRNMNGAAHNAQKIASSPELERSVQRLDTITAHLDAAAASLEKGDGTLGRLMKDDTLYQAANQAIANLNRTVVEVRALAMDLRENPKRYVHLSLF